MPPLLMTQGLFIGWASNDMDCTRVPQRSITLINDRQTIAALSGEARDPDSWIPSHLRGWGGCNCVHYASESPRNLTG